MVMHQYMFQQKLHISWIGLRVDDIRDFIKFLPTYPIFHCSSDIKQTIY